MKSYEARQYANYQIDDYRQYSLPNTSDGLAFESYIVVKIESFFQNKDGINVTQSKLKEDKLEGTDFFLTSEEFDKPIRCDFTFNFDAKDNMPFKSKRVMHLSNTPDGYDHDIHFGVRTANAKENFDEPVIVIGMTMTASQIRKEVYESYAREDIDLKDPIDHLTNKYSTVDIYDTHGHKLYEISSFYEMVTQIQEICQSLADAKEAIQNMAYDEKTRSISKLTHGTLVNRKEYNEKDKTFDSEIERLATLNIPAPIDTDNAYDAQNENDGPDHS